MLTPLLADAPVSTRPNTTHLIRTTGNMTYQNLVFHAEEALDRILHPNHEDYIAGDITGHRTRQHLLGRFDLAELIAVYHCYVTRLKRSSELTGREDSMLRAFRSILEERKDQGLIREIGSVQKKTQGSSEYNAARGRVETSEGYTRIEFYEITPLGTLDLIFARPDRLASWERGKKIDLYMYLYEKIKDDGEYPPEEAEKYWKLIQILLSSIGKNIEYTKEESRIFYGKRLGVDKDLWTKYTVRRIQPI